MSGNGEKANALGGMIRKEREAAGIGLRQLANAVHVNPSYLLRVESGAVKRPSPEKLYRISQVLSSLRFDDLCAAAGYTAPEYLPSFGPYLRAKYDMSDEDYRRLSDDFDKFVQQHGITERPHQREG